MFLTYARLSGLHEPHNPSLLMKTIMGQPLDIYIGQILDIGQKLDRCWDTYIVNQYRIFLLPFEY